MKIAVISDAHLGNPDSRFTEDGCLTGTYEAFRSIIRDYSDNKPVDFLVLNGDTLDFTANTIEESLIAAKPFFEGVYTDKLFKQLLYIPGNHDKQVWDMVEWETNIVGKLRHHKSPRKFRRTQPGVIDSATGRVELMNASHVKGTRLYGNLFLEGLFAKGSTLPIVVTYPNLYIKTKKDLILVKGDPLKDIGLFKEYESNLLLIIQDGRIYKNIL